MVPQKVPNVHFSPSATSCHIVTHRGHNLRVGWVPAVNTPSAVHRQTEKEKHDCLGPFIEL